MKSQKMTRTLIYLIYGGFSAESIKAKRFNKQYGLERVLKSFSPSIIKKAQQNLREETLRQVKSMNFEWELGNRRMKNKE